MKTVFLIAGLNIHSTAAGKEFSYLRDAITDKGYRVIPVDISWLQTTPSQYSSRFVDFYNTNKSKGENIVIGNSFGAVVAFLTAAELKPDTVLLCSPSPFFKEDLDNDWPPPQYNRLLGKRRLQDISQYSVDDIAKRINKTNVRFKILYGEDEHATSPRLVKRSLDISKRVNNSKLVEVKAAPHQFKHPTYASGIASEL